MISTLKVAALAFAVGIAPDPQSDIVEWGAKNIVVADGPYQGYRWDPSTAPYMLEPLRKFSPAAPDNRIVVRKPAQSGFTTALIVAAGYIMDQAPGQTLFLQPTQDALNDFNQDKLQPTIKASRCLKRKVAEIKPRSGEGSTQRRKIFPGGSLVLGIASSAPGLSSKTIKFLLRDEIDRYPKDVGNQGSPLDLSEARQTAFHATGDYKTWDISTPDVKGISEIDAAFEGGDQRYCHVPCTECGHLHKLEWKNFQFQEVWPFNAWFVCPSCGKAINESVKTKIDPDNCWVAENPGPGRYASYHIWAAYSQLTTWSKMAEKYVEAEQSGDPRKLQAFHNLWLAQSFEIQGEAPEWEELQKRQSFYGWGEIPPQALFLTAGVDVQADRLEAELWGWGVGRTSYLIEHVVLEGDTNNLETWKQLSEWWAMPRQTTDGRDRRIERIAVDSGYRPTMAYQWCRSRPQARAIKGASRRTDWPIDQGKVLKFQQPGTLSFAQVKVYQVGTFLLKEEFYASLGLEIGERGTPMGYVHLAGGTPDEVLRQLVSEKLVKVDKRDGTQSSEWHRLPNTRNEGLDCAVYARAAAYDLGMGRMTNAHWQELAVERGAPMEDAQRDLLEDVAGVATPPTASPVPKTDANRYLPQRQSWLGNRTKDWLN